MKKFLILMILIAVLLMAGCMPAEKAAELQKITLHLVYVPNVQFAPFYLGIEKGYFKEEGLEVTLDYANETDMLSLIGMGKENFMIASGEQVLLSRAQGLPVVSVLPWYKEYPVAITSFRETGIHSPADLKGKRIGLPGPYGASFIGFKALALNAGLKEGDYQMQSIGYTQVESLVAKAVDAVVVYFGNEPVVLRSKGYDVTTIRVSDSVHLISNGLVTNEKTIKENPELVSKLVRALRKSIDVAAANPEEAFESCKKYITNLESSEAEVQKQVLKESIKLWLTGTESFESASAWGNMQQVLLQLGLMKEAIDLKGAYSDAFLP